MKTILFAFVSLFLLSGVCVSQETSSEKSPKFEWTKTIHEFGKITQGVPASVQFEFKNTGDKPLIITNVNPSCGCAVADFPKKAVLPGKMGTIKGMYDAKKKGTFYKTFTVNSNTGRPVILKVKGEVVEK